MIQRYFFEFIIYSCWKVWLWTSAMVVNNPTRNVFVEKPRITVQYANNVPKTRKGASTCRKASRRSILYLMIRRYVFEFIISSCWKVWLDQCERCERSHKECVRREAQDHGSRCKQCVKDHQVCKYLSKDQSKIIKSKPPPQASKSMEEGPSFSSSSRNFDLEHMQQQLKVSQEDLRIAQHRLQIANNRIEAQRDLYEAQLAGYRGQGSGKVKQWGYESAYERRNRIWPSIYWFFFACTYSFLLESFKRLLN